MSKKEVNAATGRKHYSQLGEVWLRLKKNKAALVGLVIIGALILMAVLSSIIVPYEKVVTPNIIERLAKPSSEHLLGCDELGRDMLARLVYGSRYSLLIGFFAVVVSLGIGILLGSLAAFYGGKVDAVIGRVCDVFEGLPGFLLALCVTAAFGTSIYTLMLAIAFGNFAGCTRIMRGAVLSVKGQEYIEAARSLGGSNRGIIWYHIIPNCIPTIIVQATIRIGSGILYASGLSYLGLGVQPPNPEWGAMLSGGRQFLMEAPHITIFPGIFIMVTILAFNLLGDGLRDALDPRMKQ